MNIILTYVMESVYVEHVFVENVNVFILNKKPKIKIPIYTPQFTNRIICPGILKE